MEKWTAVQTKIPQKARTFLVQLKSGYWLSLTHTDTDSTQ